MYNFDFMKDDFSNSEYEKFVSDVNINLPEYKKALYDYYESNSEKFPFDEFSFRDDLILVMFLSEYEYNHDIVLKVLDDILIANLSFKPYTILILKFLNGFNVINEEEMNIRNPFVNL